MKFSELTTRIRNNSYFPKYSGWLFFMLLIIISFIYSYQSILFKPSQSIHQWRQCDCLSMTYNYYQDNNPFLEPATHNLGNDGTGKTISECPLIYYSVAMLWKLFGYHEFIYRLIVLLMFFAALAAVFKIFETALEDSVIAMTGALFLFTSPTLAYYANNYLMDVPALSLAIIGLYFFFRFERSCSDKYLYLSALFYAIAGLLKISSLLSFVAILGVFGLELIHVRFHPDRKIFMHPVKQAAVLLGVILIQLIWYMYANNYNSHHNVYFLIGILPIWDMGRAEIQATLHAIGDHIKWDYFRKETQIVFLIMLVLAFVFYRKVNKLVLVMTIFILVGFIAYILLFFNPLKDHDYYTINLFILVPFSLLVFFFMLKNKLNFIYTSLIFRILLIAFLIHNVDFARRRMSDRYNPDKWQNKYYTTNIQAFTEVGPYLDSLGITKADKVISLPDNSINISLYLMNRKGWTNYGMNADSTKIRQRINQGAKYLLISDPKAYDEPGVKPFISNKAGRFKNIDIYKLKKQNL
jgi:hypothetical protein